MGSVAGSEQRERHELWLWRRLWLWLWLWRRGICDFSGWREHRDGGGGGGHVCCCVAGAAEVVVVLVVLLLLVVKWREALELSDADKSRLLTIGGWRDWRLAAAAEIASDIVSRLEISLLAQRFTHIAVHTSAPLHYQSC